MSATIKCIERKSYDSAVKANCPYNPGIGRVYITQLRPESEKAENIQITGIPGVGHFNSGAVKIGNIYVPKESKEQITAENEVVKGIVKAVGPTHDGHEPHIKVGDLVLVFPSVFETKIKVDDIDYFSYSERDIVGSIEASKITFEKRKPTKK